MTEPLYPDTDGKKIRNAKFIVDRASWCACPATQDNVADLRMTLEGRSMTDWRKREGLLEPSLSENDDGESKQDARPPSDRLAG